MKWLKTQSETEACFQAQMTSIYYLQWQEVDETNIYTFPCDQINPQLGVGAAVIYIKVNWSIIKKNKQKPYLALLALTEDTGTPFFIARMFL